MRKYEIPEIEISNLNARDVIATSDAVGGTHTDSNLDSPVGNLKPDGAVY